MLISKNDIAIYRELSSSVADKKINPFIQDAHSLDLLPLLGEELYYDLLANPSTYNDLLNKIVYQYNGKNIESPGLKIVLCHFAYARYVMHGSQTDTPYGMVQKSYQDSTPVPRTDKKEIYKQTQQIAMQYWGQVEIYLNRNSNLYPLWRYGCATPNRTFRFNTITR